MCGRYEISPFVKEKKIKNDLLTIKIKNSGESFPGDNVPVIALNRNLEVDYFYMKWGYSLNKKLIFNCRSEEIKNKQLFKEDYFKHRCLIKASSYYEWDKNKIKYSIYADEDLYLAGIYRFYNGNFEFSILTKDPISDIAFIHERMPVIFKENQINDWLNLNNDPDDMIKESIKNLKYKSI
ncbi:MAG: SOS response-associated peptidase family protein [Erysipelotrichaceae bacterium]|nr:SOS response-associated peptidase family protein [Erysipelotrichaceae bacterium]